MIFGTWRLEITGWLGLAITVATLVLSLWAIARTRNRIDPDRPIYTMLAFATLPGIVWFALIVFHITGMSLPWRAWSRIVLATPHLAIAIVVAIRLSRPGNGKRKQ